MTNAPPVLISVDDYERVGAVARTLAEQAHPLAAPLLHELGRAELRAPDDIPEDTVLLDRFVTYRIGGSPRPERRLLIVPEDGMWPPAEVSVSTPLGITLLGLSVGDRMCMIGADERQSACVEILAVGPSAASGIARQPAFSRGSKLLPVVG